MIRLLILQDFESEDVHVNSMGFGFRFQDLESKDLGPRFPSLEFSRTRHCEGVQGHPTTSWVLPTWIVAMCAMVIVAEDGPCGV